MEELRLEFERILGYKPHHKLWEEKMKSTIAAYLVKNPDAINNKSVALEPKPVASKSEDKSAVVEVEATPIDPVTPEETEEERLNREEMEEAEKINEENKSDIEQPPFDPTGWIGEAWSMIPPKEWLWAPIAPEDMEWVTWELVIPDTRTPEQMEQDAINEAMWTVPEFIPTPEKPEVTEEEAKKITETASDNPLMTAMAMLLTSQAKTNELLAQMNEKMHAQVPVWNMVTPPDAIRNLTEAQESSPLRTKKIYKVQMLKMDLQASDGWQDRSESGQIFNTQEEAEEFGKKYGPWLTPNWSNRYRIYHESIVLASDQKDE